MSTTLRRQTGFSTLAAVFAFTLCAPISVHADEVIAAEEQLLAAVPAAPSWDETSGYGSVETSRAAIGHEEMVSGYSATGHEASAAMGLSWDEMSGYGSVEASRAANALPAAPAPVTPQVSADVRWAPAPAIVDCALASMAAAAPSWDETTGYGGVEASRAANALLAPVAGPSWDETSGYASVEGSRAIVGHPAASTTQVSSDVRWAPAGTIAPDSSIEVRHMVTPDYLPVALARGTRAESAVLWTILHQDDAVSVNPSDDRIAAALFADEPRGEDATVAVLHRTRR